MVQFHMVVRKQRQLQID